MTTLNILAIQNAALLRALAADPTTAKAELASLVGQDRSNLNRSIARLAEAGLIAGQNDGERDLTDAGREQIAAIDRAEAGGTDAPPMPDGFASIFHFQIIPDPDQARKDWESREALEDLEALADDIAARDGGKGRLLQNPNVRPTDQTVEGPDGEDLPVFMLVSGERRWRAIGILIHRFQTTGESAWPTLRPITVQVFDAADDMEIRLASLSENLQRRNLNPREKAIAFDGLADALMAAGTSPDKVNREIADKLAVTIEHVQQHRSFMKLDEADQQRLALPKDDPKRLTVRDARQKVAAAARADEAARLDVSPVARLVMAELHHAISTRAHYTYADIEVAPEAASDPYVAELIEAGQVAAPRLQQHGDMLGRWTIRLSHSVSFGPFPWANRTGDDLNAGLRAEQDAAAAEVGTTLPALDAETPYTTAWLNGPFEVTPEGQAIIDAVAEQWAENDRRNKEREARAAEVRAATEAVVQRSRDLFAAHRAAPPPTEAVAEVAQAAESPLPWRITANGGVEAADGSPVIGGGGTARSEARMRLLVLAVNAAGGFETPEDAPDPDAPLERDAFVAAMTTALTDAGRSDDAAAMLDRYLSDNGVEYGDPNGSWTVWAAEELITQFLAATDDADADDAEAA